MTQSLPHPTIEPAVMADLTDTERYRLLASERRRRVLAVLSNRTGPIACEKLAARLASAETGTTDPAAEDVREREISLHHSHLPAMADLGVLEYDATTNVVDLST